MIVVPGERFQEDVRISNSLEWSLHEGKSLFSSVLNPRLLEPGPAISTHQEVSVECMLRIVLPRQSVCYLKRQAGTLGFSDILTSTFYCMCTKDRGAFTAP